MKDNKKGTTDKHKKALVLYAKSNVNYFGVGRQSKGGAL